jgi:hypothetical protein
MAINAFLLIFITRLVINSILNDSPYTSIPKTSGSIRHDAKSRATAVNAEFSRSGEVLKLSSTTNLQGTHFFGEFPETRKRCLQNVLNRNHSRSPRKPYKLSDERSLCLHINPTGVEAFAFETAIPDSAKRLAFHCAAVPFSHSVTICGLHLDLADRHRASKA